jgi:transposase
MRRNLFWLGDEQWGRIEPYLPTDVRGKERVDDRRVISGILHVIKSGCRWSDCPPEYGPPTTIYNRFVRWAERGVWERLFRELAERGRSGDTQMIDSTHVKAHRSASGAKRMARPVGKRFLLSGLISLHKRIRPFGYAVGQDGDPRVLVLIKGPASKCHFAP